MFGLFKRPLVLLISSVLLLFLLQFLTACAQGAFVQTASVQTGPLALSGPNLMTIQKQAMHIQDEVGTLNEEKMKCSSTVKSIFEETAQSVGIPPSKEKEERAVTSICGIFSQLAQQHMVVDTLLGQARSDQQLETARNQLWLAIKQEEAVASYKHGANEDFCGLIAGVVTALIGARVAGAVGAVAGVIIGFLAGKIACSKVLEVLGLYKTVENIMHLDANDNMSLGILNGILGDIVPPSITRNLECNLRVIPQLSGIPRGEIQCTKPAGL